MLDTVNCKKTATKGIGGRWFCDTEGPEFFVGLTVCDTERSEFFGGLTFHDTERSKFFGV